MFVDVGDDKKSRTVHYEKLLHDYQDKRHSLANAKEHEVKRHSQLYAREASKYNYDQAQERVSHMYNDEKCV